MVLLPYGRQKQSKAVVAKDRARTLGEIKVRRKGLKISGRLLRSLSRDKMEKIQNPWRGAFWG